MVNVNVNAVYNTAVYSLLKSRDPTHLQKKKNNGRSPRQEREQIFR